MANLRYGITLSIISRGTNALRTATSNFGALSQAATRACKAMHLAGSMGMASGAVTQLGSAMGKVWQTPLSLASEFEATMSNVAAKSRASASEVSELAHQARALGSTSSFTAQQAAEGQAFLAQAGFQTQQILSTMPGMLNLAASANMGLAETANISTNIMSGFGLEASEAARITDVLAATMVRSNVDLTMLGDTMSYAAPVAKEFGVSLEEAAAFAGILGNAGIQGSAAGTGLRNTLLRLVSPSKSASRTMRSLGLEITDAEGKIKRPALLMQELAVAMDGLSDTKRARALKSIFGAAGIAPAAAVMAEALEGGGLPDLLDQVSSADGEAARLATQMMDNFRGSMLSFQSAMEEVGIAAGSTVLPTLRRMVDVFRSGATWLGGFVSRWPNLTKWLVLGSVAGSVLAATLGGIIAVLGTAAAAFGTMAYAVGGGITGLQIFNLLMQRTGIIAGGRFLWSLGAATLGMFGVGTGSWAAVPGLAAASTAFTTLGAAIMATPVGWVIGAVALIAGGAYLIWKNWSKLGDWMKIGILVALGPISWMVVAVGTIRKHWGSIVGFIGGVWGGLKERFLDGVAAIQGYLQPLFSAASALTKFWQPVAEFFSGLWEGVKEVFSGALDWILKKTEGIRKVADKIVAFLPDWVGGSEEESVDSDDGEAVASTKKRRKPSVRSGPAVETLAPGAAELGRSRTTAKPSPSRVELVVRSSVPVETRRIDAGSGVDLSVDTGYAHGGVW